MVLSMCSFHLLFAWRAATQTVQALNFHLIQNSFVSPPPAVTALGRACTSSLLTLPGTSGSLNCFYLTFCIEFLYICKYFSQFYHFKEFVQGWLDFEWCNMCCVISILSKFHHNPQSTAIAELVPPSLPHSPVCPCIS
ncbi:hypothetical protein OTU49_011039 [Cherax quadricarinatus]|uniref:Secreted protein n=1 Tax=Cherax quadricarinatus TaxID=27406 RepID=A0AAW0W7U8_CHEQU